jgi:hypothetical protein
MIKILHSLDLFCVKNAIFSMNFSAKKNRTSVPGSGHPEQEHACFNVLVTCLMEHVTCLIGHEIWREKKLAHVFLPLLTSAV